MRHIVPRPLTAAAFAPFGEVIQAGEAKSAIVINRGQTLRFHDLATIDVADGEGRAALSIFRGEPLTPCLLAVFECHPLGSQAFIPLGGNGYLVAVAPAGGFDPSSVSVFRAAPYQGVNYAKGTWHHFLLPLGGTSEFLVIDREGPGENLVEVALDPIDRIMISA